MEIIKSFKAVCLGLVAGSMVLTSCNKDLEQLQEPVNPPTGDLLGKTLAANADDSLYYRLVTVAGYADLLNNPAQAHTLFVPNNNAMKAVISALSGGQIPTGAPNAVFSAFITATAQTPQILEAYKAIVQYNIIPQVIKSSSISNQFPNFQYPSIFNPAPSVSPLLRLTTFPSTRNGAWLNNVPITGVDQGASNGVIHHTATLVAPPSKFLWERISTDPELTYLKAAINRADSGATAQTSLEGFLKNIGANFTVFAPTDAAFKNTLYGAIAQALISQNVPIAIALQQATQLSSTPDVFSNPLLYGVLTAQTVRGIVAYHVLTSRAFTNNLPTTGNKYPTVLSGVLNNAPFTSLLIEAKFGAGSPFVSEATVKGSGNTAKANVIINTTPLLSEPNGTSDQHYLNGVLHKIDDVLIPAP